MNRNERSVDFIIRAKNQSKRTLDEVRKEIEAVNDVIDKQVEASKRGEGSMKALDAAYRRLAEVTKDLTSQQKLLSTYEAQSTRLAELERRLSTATTKLREHQEQMAASEKVTKSQENTSTRLQKAVDRASEALQKQSTRLADTREEAEKLGMSLDDTDAAQEHLLATARKLASANSTLSQSQQLVAENNEKARREAEKLADAQEFAAKAQQAQQLIKAADYANWWTEALQKAEQAEKDAAAVDAIKQKAADAQKLIKAADYANWWTEALQKAEVTEKRLADQTMLNDMADRAIAAARGFRTLGDASKRLQQNASPLSDTIRAINDPTAQARKTLAGLEEEISSLAGVISAINGPVEGYQEKMRALASAQKAAVDTAGNIDAYNQQIQALRAAREAYSKARQAAVEYANSIRGADEPTAEMTAELNRLQAQVQQASQALGRVRASAAEARNALREAGIDTSRLTDEQIRLVQSARTAREAAQKLAEAYRNNGEQAERAARRTGIFRDEGRTTLSMTQRLRGEILSLTASYLGLQGAIDLAAGSIDAYNDKEGIKSQLSISKDIGNDAELIGEELEYIIDLADRVGVSFEGIAKPYAKFSASASQAGRSRQEIRFVAESFTEVARVANLSADELDGVFKALEQMYSKGKIQAEELRGQLGDRLFGAFEVFAKALEDDFDDLNKAMEDGLVTSDYLVKAAAEYRNLVAGSLDDATDRLAAHQARLNNEVLFFKQTIAEAGFADQYGRLVEILTEFFQSEDGQRFAEGLSDAFGLVVDLLGFLVENLDAVEAGTKAFATVWATIALARSAEGLKAVISGLREMNTQMDEGSKKAKILRGSLAAINALVVGWQIGTWARKEFAAVELAGNTMVEYLLLGWNRIKYRFEIAMAAITGYGENALNILKQKFAEWYNEVAGILADIARITKMRFLAPAIETTRFDESKQEMRDVGKELEQLRTKMENEAKRIKDIFADMNQDMRLRRQGLDPAGVSTGGPGSVTDKPDFTPPPPKDAKDTTVAKAAIEASKRATDAILADLSRQEAAQQRLYDKSLISVDKYYAERSRIAAAKLDAEIGSLQQQYAELNAVSTKGSDKDLKRQSKMADLQAEISELSKQKAEAERQFAFEAEQAKKQLSDQAAELRNSVLDMQSRLDLNGDSLQAALSRNLAKYEDLIEAATRLGGVEGARMVTAAQTWKLLADQQAKLEAMGVQAQKLEDAARRSADATQAQIDAGRSSGSLTDIEAMRAEGEANRVLLGQLAEIRDAYRAMGLEGAEAAAAIEAEMTRLAADLDPVADEIRGKFEGAFDGFFDNLIMKRQSFSEAFRQLGYDLASDFAKMWIKEATQQLMKWFIQNQIFRAMAGGFMGGAGAGVSAGVYHTGGVVGAGGGVSRSGVNPSWFIGAPKYHEGGVVGLKRDEYTAILQKNEEVLTTGDPRHVFNGGQGAGGSAQPAIQDVSVNNYVDAQSFMDAALATPEGRKAIVNVIQSERTKVRQLVGS